MSNVIKYWGSKEESSEKIINSNPKADAYLLELLRLRREKEEEKEQEIQLAKAREAGDLEFQEMSLTKFPKRVDFSQLEKEARQKAEEIIEEASARKEEILSRAIEEARRKEEEIRFSASEEGYKEGYQRAIEEIRQKEAELEAEKERLQENYEEEIRKLEPKFANLVIKYVEKLTGILAEEYESIIYNVMALGISNAEPSKTYIIHVPKEQYKYVRSKEDYIRELAGEHARVEIISDTGLKVNSCKIETDNCVIDTSLDTRLMMLTHSIKLLSEYHE